MADAPVFLQPFTEPPPLCSAKHGLLECMLEAAHGGFHFTITPTPEGMTEVQWADGCPAWRDNLWMNSLAEDKDDGMDAVYTWAVPKDGRVSLDWFRN